MELCTGRQWCLALIKASKLPFPQKYDYQGLK